MVNRYSWHRVGTKGGGSGPDRGRPLASHALNVIRLIQQSFMWPVSSKCHSRHFISFISFYSQSNHLIVIPFIPQSTVNFDAFFSFFLISLFWQSFASFEIDLSHFSVIPVIHLWHKGGTITQTPPLCANSVPRISVDHWVRGVWAYYYLGFRPRRPLAIHGLGLYPYQRFAQRISNKMPKMKGNAW